MDIEQQEALTRIENGYREVVASQAETNIHLRTIGDRLREIIDLLTPPQDAEGPSLAELLVQLIEQSATILTLLRAIGGATAGLRATLPADVAVMMCEALGVPVPPQLVPATNGADHGQ